VASEKKYGGRSSQDGEEQIIGWTSENGCDIDVDLPSAE
jgi:hypothetical protein